MMLKKILLFLILSFSAFALKIDDVDMNKTVKVGERASKTFKLSNDKKYPLRYRLSIENNVKGVKVIPSTLLIPAFSEKSFKVSVEGINKGEKVYFLVLDEEPINLQTEGSSAKIKMKYRIEQKYTVE